MREEAIVFKSGELSLSGLLARPAALGQSGGAVVCHPHPLFGGSMHNNVVEAILDAMWALGTVTLRFNFRGVAGGQGSFGDGGEGLDAIAAVKFIAGYAGVRPDNIMLAGYSFGAAIAMEVGPALEEVATMVLVAPPVSMMREPPRGPIRKPILVVAGADDQLCPSDDIRKFFMNVSPEVTLRVIAAADHFFVGHERKLAQEIVAALNGLSGKSLA